MRRRDALIRGMHALFALGGSGLFSIRPAFAHSLGNGAAFVDVPTYAQQRSLSCEYASLVIARGAYGTWVSEWTFDGLVPQSDNPHWGYRGDINGTWGNTTNYGVYTEARPEATLAGFGALPGWRWMGNSVLLSALAPVALDAGDEDEQLGPREATNGAPRWSAALLSRMVGQHETSTPRARPVPLHHERASDSAPSPAHQLLAGIGGGALTWGGASAAASPSSTAPGSSPGRRDRSPG
jgi:hypothetical protein